MAKKVSLINMKGGVGKSTLAVNLAWFFYHFRRKRVLLVDLDPQFNASQYMLGLALYSQIHQQNAPTIWNVFEQFSHSPHAPSPTPLASWAVVHNVESSIPDGTILSDKQIAEELGMTFEEIRVRVGALRDTLKGTLSSNAKQVTQPPGDPQRASQARAGNAVLDLIPSRLELACTLRAPAQKEGLLAQLIAKLEWAYDLVLFDCAPTESFLTYAAYAASDSIVVPVKPEFLSTIGLPLLAQSLAEYKQQNNGVAPAIAGIVFNHNQDYVPEEVRSKGEVRGVAKTHNWYVFDNEVPYSRSFPKGDYSRVG